MSTPVRRVAAIAVPALGSLAADPLLSLVDTAFVSRLGRVPLAALGIDAAVFMFAFALFNFLAYATTPMVSRAWGAGDRLAAGRVVERALALAVVGGVAAAVVLVVLGPGIVRLMQAPVEVVEPTVSYLRVRASAVVAVLVVTAGHGAFRGIQDTRTPLLVSLGIAALNAVLDPLLMFGLGWGIVGAAVATAVAQWAGAIVFVVLIVRRSEARSWEVRRLRLSGLRPFLVLGGAIVMRTVLLITAFSAATAVAARSGTAVVGAHQVVSQVWLLSAMAVDALAIAAQTLVAEALGRGERARARRLGDLLLGMGLATGVGLAVILLAAGPVVSALFADDPAVAASLRTAIPIAAGMQPVAALVFVADGIYLAALAVRRLVASTAAGLAAMAVGLWVTVDAGFGLAGVWWATTGLIGARAVVLAAGYRRLFQPRRIHST